MDEAHAWTASVWYHQANFSPSRTMCGRALREPSELGGRDLPNAHFDDTHDR